MFRNYTRIAVSLVSMLVFFTSEGKKSETHRSILPGNRNKLSQKTFSYPFVLLIDPVKSVAGKPTKTQIALLPGMAVMNE